MKGEVIVNGTFLNFFECKLSNNIAEIHTLDYKDKDSFNELKNKYPDIFFYRFEGNKIYYWKKYKHSIIPDELKGICIHVSLDDYPQIFRLMLINGISNLFNQNGAFVQKCKYSSTIEIHSNKNVINNIEGLEVKKILLLDSLYSKENKMLGITLAFKNKNTFTWDTKQMIEHRVDIGDLKIYDNKVSCNKVALNRFLQSTNSEQLYKTMIYKMNSFSEQYNTTIGTYGYLKNHLSDIFISDNVQISNISLNNLPYKNDAFNMVDLKIPNHYYYSNKTQNGRYDEALKVLKPYTYEIFSNKIIKCAVLCPKKYEGTEENFSVGLKRKLHDIFSIEMEFNKYYMEDTNIKDYKDIRLSL